jgi:hypothetical protein
MIQYRSAAMEQLDAPAGTLLLEWSAPADADPDDPDTWAWASPEWTEKRKAFVARQHSTIEESSFRREWCNQWVTTLGRLAQGLAMGRHDVRRRAARVEYLDGRGRVGIRRAGARRRRGWCPR